MGSRTLNLLQQLSLQHVMVSELRTDFTATLHLSPGLYTSYFRLSWFMSILYIMCASCAFSPYARFPCMLLSFVTVQFTPPMSQIIPKEVPEKTQGNPGKPTGGQGPVRRPRKEGEKEPNVAANIAFLNCCIVFPSCC